MNETPMTVPAPATEPLTPADLGEITGSILASVTRVIDGQPDTVHSALVALLAEGPLHNTHLHGVRQLLLERALGASRETSVRRPPFLPKHLTAEVIGAPVSPPDAP